MYRSIAGLVLFALAIIGIGGLINHADPEPEIFTPYCVRVSISHATTAQDVFKPFAHVEICVDGEKKINKKTELYAVGNVNVEVMPFVQGIGVLITSTSQDAMLAAWAINDSSMIITGGAKRIGDYHEVRLVVSKK